MAICNNRRIYIVLFVIIVTIIRDGDTVSRDQREAV